MARYSASTLVLSGALLGAGAVLAADAPPAWLFVQTASGFTANGTTLSVPYEREIFAFTDRPNRLHAHINAHEMVNLWELGKDTFAEDPPNAVLTWVDNGQIREAEIELLSASVDDLGRAITYEIATESSAVLPEFGAYASLFVDDWFDKGTFCSIADDQVKEGIEGVDMGAAVGEEIPTPQDAVNLGVGTAEHFIAGC